MFAYFSVASFFSGNPSPLQTIQVVGQAMKSNNTITKLLFYSAGPCFPTKGMLLSVCYDPQSFHFFPVHTWNACIWCISHVFHFGVDIVCGWSPWFDCKIPMRFISCGGIFSLPTYAHWKAEKQGWEKSSFFLKTPKFFFGSEQKTKGFLVWSKLHQLSFGRNPNSEIVVISCFLFFSVTKITKSSPKNQTENPIWFNG